jgi:hypothetical protein
MRSGHRRSTCATQEFARSLCTSTMVERRCGRVSVQRRDAEICALCYRAADNLASLVPGSPSFLWTFFWSCHRGAPKRPPSSFSAIPPRIRSEPDQTSPPQADCPLHLPVGGRRMRFRCRHSTTRIAKVGKAVNSLKHELPSARVSGAASLRAQSLGQERFGRLRK